MSNGEKRKSTDFVRHFSILLHVFCQMKQNFLIISVITANYPIYTKVRMLCNWLQSILGFYSRHSFSQPHDKKYFICLELSDDDAFWSKSVRQTRQSMHPKQSALFFQDTWQRTQKPRMPKPDNQTTDKTASWSSLRKIFLSLSNSFCILSAQRQLLPKWTRNMLSQRLR